MDVNSICLLEPSHAPARRLFDIRQWSITRCASCGLIMTGSGFEESQYEDQTYYTMKSDRREDVYFEWAFRWRWILEQISKRARPGDLLDVGAGNGLFVKLAREEFNWDSTGIEFSKAEIEFAEKILDVRLEHKLLKDVDRQFDVVTAFNVLEHVVDPQGLINEMGSRLRDGGLMVITTPNPSCIQARVKGLRRWGMIAPPHHINIFTREALELAVRNAGFEVVDYQTLSTYVLALRRLERRGTLLRSLIFNALRLAGLGADHFVIAARPGVAAA